MAWRAGETVLRREVWRGRPWMGTSVIVVADEPELLATYLPSGAAFAFADGHPLGPHPWTGRPVWQGHGVLMLQRPAERYAVWHFWDGPGRVFVGWYLNLQEPARRTTAGFDTQDLELDVWLPAVGAWSFKDDDLLEERVRQGRFSSSEAASIRKLGDEIGAMIDAGQEWWDRSFAQWQPDPGWGAPPLPDGWELAEPLEP